MRCRNKIKEALNNFQPFGLRQSKPRFYRECPTIKLRANGVIQSSLNDLSYPLFVTISDFVKRKKRSLCKAA
jgi:hypothetical protein